MLQHPAAVRAAFHDASESFLAVLRAVRPEQWDRPGALGDWTTRELAAHALRAYVTVDGYLSAAPTTDRILADAGEYYATVLVEVGVHTLDLQRAIGAPVELADSTTDVVLQVLVQLASPVPLILALSGRQTLPVGFNVLG